MDPSKSVYLCKEKTDFDVVDSEIVPPTDLSYKTFEEIEIIYGQLEVEQLEINERWEELGKWHKQNKRLRSAVTEYKYEVLEELFDSEIMRKVLLRETMAWMMEDVESDMLNLKFALWQLSTLSMTDDERNKIICNQSCERKNLKVYKKPKVKFCLNATQTEECSDFPRLIDSTWANIEFALLSDECDEYALQAEALMIKKKDFEHEEQQVEVILKKLKKILKEKDEAEKIFLKINKEYPKLLANEIEKTEEKYKRVEINLECESKPDDNGESLDQSFTDMVPTLFEMISTVKQGICEEQTMKEAINVGSISTEAADLNKGVEYFDPVLTEYDAHLDELANELANELVTAKLELDKAFAKNANETDEKLQKLNHEKLIFEQKLEKLTDDYESFSQGNIIDTEKSRLFRKNIDCVKRKLDSIKSYSCLARAEGYAELIEIKLKFDLKALVERLELGTARKLLAETQKKPTIAVLQRLSAATVKSVSPL